MRLPWYGDALWVSKLARRWPRHMLRADIRPMFELRGSTGWGLDFFATELDSEVPDTPAGQLAELHLLRQRGGGDRSAASLF